MLELIEVEKQQLQKIAQSCDQSIESLLLRLEKLTWEDGLLEFRMQVALLPWQEAICKLSDLVNARLRREGIPFDSSRKAYEEWLTKQ
jgi:hypothetical protein